MEKYKKSHTKIINLKYQLQHVMKNLNNLMDHSLYQILKIILNILLMMKLLGSNKSKITKGKNGENVPNLEITEVVLVHCNAGSNDYQQDSRVLYTFIPNK